MAHSGASQTSSSTPVATWDPRDLRVPGYRPRDLTTGPLMSYSVPFEVRDLGSFSSQRKKKPKSSTKVELGSRR
ncbi:hypothetical protein JX266_010695 [Neoarthrinium moseri]|nr:hypothetical protein JX266_010695 [Neoarthrinium moseri]